MAQKQGGTGKQSSPSDKAYWARKGTGGSQKTRRIEQHARRMGKTLKQLESSGALSSPTFPRVQVPRELEKVVFSGTVKDNFPAWAVYGHVPHFVISDGVTIGVEARETDAMGIFSQRKPGAFAKVVRASPIETKILAYAFR